MAVALSSSIHVRAFDMIWQPTHTDHLYYIAGNSTATARDPARGGTTYGPLEVMADLKEPVSALKSRMIEKAAESGYIVVDDKERYVK